MRQDSAEKMRKFQNKSPEFAVSTAQTLKYPNKQLEFSESNVLDEVCH